MSSSKVYGRIFRPAMPCLACSADPWPHETETAGGLGARQKTNQISGLSARRQELAEILLITMPLLFVLNSVRQGTLSRLCKAMRVMLEPTF